jgi:hypothetical protein
MYSLWYEKCCVCISGWIKEVADMIHYASANIYPEALHNRIKRTIAARLASIEGDSGASDVKEEVDELIDSAGLAESAYEAIGKAIYVEFKKQDVFSYSKDGEGL